MAVLGMMGCSVPVSRLRAKVYSRLMWRNGVSCARSL
jgi:hypothetical protein